MYSIKVIIQQREDGKVFFGELSLNQLKQRSYNEFFRKQRWDNCMYNCIYPFNLKTMWIHRKGE